MAVVVGKLNAILTANTMKFDSRMKRSAGVAQKFGMATGKGAMMAKAGLAGVAVAAAAAAASLVLVTKRAFDEMDAQAKLADRLGITTEKLAGLKHAGELSGISSDQLGTAIEKLQRQLGEAALRGGVTAEVMGMFGLEAKKLMNMRADEQLRVIADKFQDIENPAMRARLATELFGRSGIQMINMLMGGRKALDEVQKKIERYGLAINRIDHAKIEAANDAMTDLKAAFKGLGQTFAVTLAPTLTVLITRMSEFVGWINTGIKRMTWLGEQVGKFLGYDTSELRKGISGKRGGAPGLNLSALLGGTGKGKAPRQWESWAELTGKMERMKARDLRPQHRRRERARLVEKQNISAAPGSAGIVDLSQIDIRGLVKPAEIKRDKDDERNALLKQIAQSTKALAKQDGGLN